MATSVKMDEKTKSQLERLQAEIKLKTGTKVTQQEVLERLVERGVDSEAELVDSFRDEFVPLTEAEREYFHEGMFDSGTETDEEDIDDILYG
jgi:hypothetical protein